jgi:Restriction endonuclease
MGHKDKTGQSYENLVRVIFQSILHQKDFQNLSVERNVKLRGKTTSHQIDIYWKFEVGGVPHEVIVQAKDWSTPVKKGQLLQFKEVLDDLSGQPRGVFVTRSGYQKGAKDYALAHGILLYELKEFDTFPSLEVTVGAWVKISHVRVPLHGLVKKESEELNLKRSYALDFVFDVCTSHFIGMNFDVAQSWLEQECPEKDFSDVRRLDFGPTPLNEISLYNQDGAAVGNLHELFLRLSAVLKEESVDQKWVPHAFTEPTFIRVPSLDIPQLKIDAVSVNVEIQHSHHTRRGKMSNFSQFVLHQLNSDQKWWFAATPSVLAGSDESK